MFTIFSQVLFENQATNLNINITYGSGLFGGGISFYDYNNDGLDDITLSTGLGSNFLFYKNTGTSFINENLPINGGNIETKQVIWVDFDNDGDNDFFAAGYQSVSRLFRNDSNNVFVDVTSSCGLPLNNHNTFGSSWGDYNNDGFLDVFMSIRDENFIDYNLLFKNNGNGTFTNMTFDSGLHLTGKLTFCAAFFDYDKDGFQDLYLANDKMLVANILYKNNGDGSFTDVSFDSGTDLIMDAMCTTIDDYNNDGYLDIYIANTNSTGSDVTTGNALLENNGDGTFTNVAVNTGTQFNSIGWGSVFLDADNDSDHDLYVSSSKTGEFGLLPSAFYENDGNGNFSIPINAGFSSDVLHSFSNAIGDVDNDGYPEIAVMNNFGESMFLWKNLCPQTNNWLKVKLVGTTSNKMGIGSWIEVGTANNVQYNYTLCGEGYLGQNSGSEFFGLGTNTIVDYIKVTWLSGNIDYFDNIAVNQTIIITENSSPLVLSESNINKIEFYPNPAKDVINIDLNLMDKTMINIIDMFGKIILHKELTKNKNTIDIKYLEKGIYVIKLDHYSYKFIKK
jgi:hypothetical protein